MAADSSNLAVLHIKSRSWSRNLSTSNSPVTGSSFSPIFLSAVLSNTYCRYSGGWGNFMKRTVSLAIVVRNEEPARLTKLRVHLSMFIDYCDERTNCSSTFTKLELLCPNALTFVTAFPPSHPTANIFIFIID